MANEVIGEARQGQASIRSSGGVPILDETYHFLVKSDDIANSRINILLTEGLPITNLTVSAFGFTICKSKSAVRREDQPLYWDVTCEFSSEVEENSQGPGDGEQATTGPLEWVPIYETKFERLDETLTKDAAGTAVANSAGQPFENGLIRTRFIPIWEFFQFESATVSDESVIERNETINSAVFKGRAVHTLLLTVVSSSIGFYYGERVRLTRYALRYNLRTWKVKRLDVGTVYKSGATFLPYLDDEANIMLGGLNGSGAKVTVGDPPAVLEFLANDALDFNSFLRL